MNDNYGACEWELDGLAFKESPQANGKAYAVLNIFGVSWTWLAVETGDKAWETERKWQAALVREVFGNPFRTVKVKRGWLKWNDGKAVKLAQAIYDERTFARLPILADSLEEAGCNDADILSHCRGPGPHVRGCWVVDLLLGKE